MKHHDEAVESWQRTEEIFSAAVERPPADRAGFLDEACAGEPTLRAEVMRLLAADRQADSFLDQPLGEAPAGRPPAGRPPAAAAGRRIGPYELLRELGHGGMGSVFLARRADDQHERQVAIKLMRYGGESRELRQRFTTEQQALARLEHVYIARMYDSGETPEGQPFLVMEYVPGVPIDQYCDQQKLDVEARIRLFRQVCEAVEFAHRNLLVHRDVKPTNILVTADGTPKLLDFGIAKLLDAGELGIDRTRTGLRLMSPRWASPEQVLGQAISTATDVYSLGVLLYVLLSGEHPYTFPEGEPEAWRVVCERQPKRPSSAILKSGPDNRKAWIRPQELKRSLRGDLDNIVLKALEKEPRRRYGSVEQLSNDLRRHLERRPVKARPATVGYRFAKFLRRHRLAVAAAAAAAVLIGGFVFTLLRQAERISLERDRAEQALEFVLSLFQGSDPNEGLGKDVTARQILELGAQRISNELTEQPEIQATLMDAIGEVYLALGLFEEASPLVHGGLEIRRRILGEEHVDVAESLNRLAELHHYRGDYDEAEPLYRRALELRGSLPGVAPEELARTLNSLGALVRGRGEYEEARTLHREALVHQRLAPAPDEGQISATLNYLALVAERLGDYPRALELYREILDVRRRLMGEDYAGVGQTLNNLGAVLNELGRYGEAEEVLRQADEINLAKLEADHYQITDTRARLAVALWRQGDAETAEPIFREAVEKYRATFGERGYRVLVTGQNLAMLLADVGRLDEAEALLRELGGKSPPPPARWNVAYAVWLSNMAEVQSLQGDQGAAEEALRRALDILRRKMAPGHLRNARPLQGLGKLLTERGELAEAEDLLRRALEILRRTVAPETLPIALAEGNLGACLSAGGDYLEAEPLLLHSQAVLAARLPAGHRDLAMARSRLADLYRGWGRPEKLAAP